MDEREGAEYYAAKLSAERLRQCYEIASPRVRQYLDAETGFAVGRLIPTDEVLELGCGYGRVALELGKVARRVVGIDTSGNSLELARRLAGDCNKCEFIEMNAANLALRDAEFDAVICVQNGVCAFGVDPLLLLSEAVRVTRPGDWVLFSTYASQFWLHRLEWFEAQAQAGLVGVLDYDETGGGTIACKDGFRVGMLTPGELRGLGYAVGIEPRITEVDGSSVFAEWVVPVQKLFKF